MFHLVGDMVLPFNAFNKSCETQNNAILIPNKFLDGDKRPREEDSVDEFYDFIKTANEASFPEITKDKVIRLRIEAHDRLTLATKEKHKELMARRCPSAKTDNVERFDDFMSCALAEEGYRNLKSVWQVIHGSIDSNREIFSLKCVNDFMNELGIQHF